METHPFQPQLSLQMSAWVFLAGWDEGDALPSSPPSVQMQADFLEGPGSRGAGEPGAGSGWDAGGGEKRIASNKELCVKRIFKKWHLSIFVNKIRGVRSPRGDYILNTQLSLKDWRSNRPLF